MQHNQTKVSLSKFELDLVTDAKILLTKNQIIQKVYTMFGEVAHSYTTQLQQLGQAQMMQPPAKISRGENYEGLPYVMLDYPRRFKKEDTFAIRTLFWWGNFFSITLQLSGASFMHYKLQILGAANQQLLNEWHVGVSEDLWQHHFREDNFRPVINSDLSDILDGATSIKLAKKIPLQEWDNSKIFFEQNFTFLLSMLFA